ncbi:MAG: NUDIX hydrolase [Chitinophagaceae bacterium]
MYFKIFFDDKPLFLTDKIYPEIEPFAHHDDAVLIDECSPPALHALLHEMNTAKIHAGILLHPDLEKVKKAFWKKFKVIQAAGGVVTNDQKELLLIFRRGKWDLPKGKLDPGETLETCALRETREETGLQQLQPGPALCTTYHTYQENGKSILKETYWYRLQAPGAQPLIPQTQEQISELRWVPKTALPGYFSETYASVLDVLKIAGY